MADIRKLLEYKELCGVNNKEIAKSGAYSKSEPWLCKVLKGEVNCNDENYREIMIAISRARANKLAEQDAK